MKQIFFMLKLKNNSLLIWWTNNFLYFCERFDAKNKGSEKCLTKKNVEL